ncbi:MAG: hypothetical protein ACE147_12315 [Candidatus Methylomirabilales bacterium]
MKSRNRNREEAGGQAAPEIEEAGAPRSRRPYCDPPDAYADVTDTLRKIRKERGRPLFALMADAIDSGISRRVFDWRALLRQAGAEGPLDVLLHSQGGRLNECYTIARLFARCTDAWDALVPERAASGATMIALGSARLVMAETAELGPLDPQVTSKRRERFFSSERQSPLEAFQSVRYLREFSLESIDEVMRFLLDKRVTHKLALEAAAKVSADLVRPILERIEPFDLGAFALDSRVAIEYCSRIARPASGAKQAQRNVNPRALVENYPAHEFVIDSEEAESLGFALSPPAPEIDALFDTLRKHLPRVRKYVGLIA